LRRFGGGHGGAFVIHHGGAFVIHPGGGAGELVTLAVHGEAAAMYGVPEAVHARGDDGRSAEELRAGVPAGETTKARAGAKTSGPGGIPRC